MLSVKVINKEFYVDDKHDRHNKHDKRNMTETEKSLKCVGTKTACISVF